MSMRHWFLTLATGSISFVLLLGCASSAVKDGIELTANSEKGVLDPIVLDPNISDTAKPNLGGVEGFVASRHSLPHFALRQAEDGIRGEQVRLPAEDSAYLFTWAITCQADSLMAMSPPAWPVFWEFSSEAGAGYTAILVGPDRLRFNQVSPYSARSFTEDGEKRIAWECQGGDEGGRVWETLTRILGPTQVKEYGIGF